MKAITADLPRDLLTLGPRCCLLLILGDKRHQLRLIVDHKHCLHVAETEAIIAALGASRDLIPDGIDELFNEKVVGDLGNILLLLEDFLIATLYEVGFQRHGHFNVDICLDILLWNQLNLSVVLRDPAQKVKNWFRLKLWWNLLIVGE